MSESAGGVLLTVSLSVGLYLSVIFSSSLPSLPLRLYGLKWFTSAVDAAISVALARIVPKGMQQRPLPLSPPASFSATFPATRGVSLSLSSHPLLSPPPPPPLLLRLRRRPVGPAHAALRLPRRAAEAGRLAGRHPRAAAQGQAGHATAPHSRARAGRSARGELPAPAPERLQRGQDEEGDR